MKKRINIKEWTHYYLHRLKYEINYHWEATTYAPTKAKLVLHDLCSSIAFQLGISIEVQPSFKGNGSLGSRSGNFIGNKLLSFIDLLVRRKININSFPEKPQRT